MVSALRRISKRDRRDFAENAHGEAGAGERLAQNNFARQAQFESQLAHFVLEQAFQRFDQLEPHFLRQAADVVMALDHRGGIAGDRHGLDHVGIKRALREEFRFAGAFGGRFENFDERFADDLAFALRVGHAFEPLQEQLRGVLVLQFDLEMPPENLAHDLRFASAQHAVVDENAGELVANGFVQQRRRHAGIHAAAQAEDHLLLADLRADLLDRLVDVVVHRPVLAAAANVVDEVGDDFPAARRVHDFRMELQAEQFAVAVSRSRRNREFSVTATDLKPLRQLA